MALVDMSETFQMTNVGEHIDGTDVYQSNRNLLDNPWFTVNQRAAATVSSVGYHLDRWYSYNNYTVTANGITTTSAGNFDQTLESALKTALNGQTVTMSAKLADGTVYSATGTYYSAYGSTYSIGSGGGITFYITGDGKARYTFGNNLSIRAVKLELGSVSTLANDTPPNYAEELAKCQRYFFRIDGGYHPFGVGDAPSATQVRIFVPTPVTMRREGTHTVTTNGYITIRGSGMTGTAPTNVVWNTVDTNGVSLAFTVTGATAYEVYLGIFAGAGYIDLSADL